MFQIKKQLVNFLVEAHPKRLKMFKKYFISHFITDFTPLFSEHHLPKLHIQIVARFETSGRQSCFATKDYYLTTEILDPVVSKNSQWQFLNINIWCKSWILSVSYINKIITNARILLNGKSILNIKFYCLNTTFHRKKNTILHLVTIANKFVLSQ